MRVRHVALALAAMATSACAARMGPARSPLPDIVERPGGPDLAVLARATDAVRLSLWVDAGSRDADPPQVATLAAWTAADAAGPEVAAWVTPDAMEFSTPCTRAELPACAARLAGVLARREVDPEALARARARLEAGRRLAIARDPGRAADRLALAALLGEQGVRGLVPLGDAADDGAATADGIVAFLRAHFGPARALVVAAGDVDLRVAEDAVRGAFSGLPGAGSARSTRAREALTGGVRVQEDEANYASIALAAKDEHAALAAVNALERALRRPPTSAPVHAHVFVVRGGALAVARVARDVDAARVDAIVAEAVRQHAGAPGVQAARDALAPRAPDGDLRALSRRAALAWSARGEATLTPAIGIGVLVAADRASGTSGARDAIALRERTTRRLEGIWQNTAAPNATEPATQIGDALAMLRLPNGARVETAWRPGTSVAIALRLAPGAGEDPPLAHGRAAALAVLVAVCARREGDALAPHVDAASWGVTLVAPSADWEPALDRVLDCALEPSFAPTDIVAARRALRRRMGDGEASRALRAEAARRVAPASPGIVAPWGSPAGVAGAADADIEHAWKSSAVGARIALALVGDFPMRLALDHAARRLSSLPAGASRAPAAKTAPATPSDDRIAVPTGPQRVVVTWRDDGAPQDPTGAWAFAAALRAVLASVPGIEVRSHDGDAEAGVAWAALALSVEPTAFADLDAHLRHAQAQLDESTLAHAVERTWIVAEREIADDAARIDDAADGLARSALGARTPARARDAALELARRLSATAPRWSVAP